jgi:hypothetical protein
MTHWIDKPILENIYAPWWKLALARALGEKRMGFDDDFAITSYWWRGRMYVTKVERLPSPTAALDEGGK